MTPTASKPFIADLPERITGTGIIVWTPGVVRGCGTLVIRQKRKGSRKYIETTYIVYERDRTPTGRVFRFMKPEGEPGTDAEAEEYDCYLGSDATAQPCYCRGHLRHGNCKHYDSIVLLTGAGLL